MHHRRLDARIALVVLQERRPALVAGQHQQRLAGAHRRQLLVMHGEAAAAPAGQAAEVGREDRRRALLLQGRGGGEQHRQLQPRVVALVEERRREVGQVVDLGQRLLGQLDAAVARQVQPQRAAGRVRAGVVVAPDELQAQAVEIAEQLRVEGQALAHALAGLAGLRRQHAHQRIVEVDAHMGLAGQQRRRGGVFQVQLRGGGQTVAAQAELHLIAAADAQQQAVGIPAELLEAVPGFPARRRRVFACGRQQRRRQRLSRQQGQTGQPAMLDRVRTLHGLNSREAGITTADGVRGTKLNSQPTSSQTGCNTPCSHAGAYSSRRR